VLLPSELCRPGQAAARATHTLTRAGVRALPTAVEQRDERPGGEGRGRGGGVGVKPRENERRMHRFVGVREA